MRRQRLLTADDPCFDFCWTLYVEAFPEEERRALGYHLETLERDAFRFEVILLDDEPIGFFGWWDLDDFRYVEHFATSPDVRGRGYGEEALRQFIGEGVKPVILEVEPPVEEIARRRIGFYERVGFILNPHAYAHPSYHDRQAPFVELMIMSSPAPITSAILDRFKQSHFPLIHFQHFEV